MYSIKVINVSKPEGSISHEFAPVETLEFKEKWPDFVKWENGKAKGINYDILEQLVKKELEPIVLSRIQEPSKRVVELKVETDDYLVLVTTMRDIEKYSQCKDIFNTKALTLPTTCKEIFTFSSINRLNYITSVTVVEINPFYFSDEITS